MIFLEQWAGPLLLLHMAAGAVAAVPATLLLVRLGPSLGRRSGRPRPVALHGRILALAYGICFFLGALVYPTFRVRVRHEYFDHNLPWATGLFEIKEHLAALGLVAALAAWQLSRRIPRAGEGTDESARTAAGPCFAYTMAVWSVLLFSIVAGLYLTGLRSL